MHELCDDFCRRYITCLKGKWPSDLEPSDDFQQSLSDEVKADVTEFEVKNEVLQKANPMDIDKINIRPTSDFNQILDQILNITDQSLGEAQGSYQVLY